MTMDLNSDMGERDDIREDRILALVSSANVSCGAHAGTPATLKRTLRMAKHHGVVCGAHPSYPDRENFGRVEMPLSLEEIEAAVERQIRDLAAIAAEAGVELAHVKPHGALYNIAARSESIARAIARGVARWSRSVTLVGLARSHMIGAWNEMGFPVAAEAFADRAYESNGSLRPRSSSGALITDPIQAAEQALALARRGDIQTLCIHSDTPGAEWIAASVRARLEQEGIVVRAMGRV
ncbi:MAG: LamB/YcsF family protein [Acidobacteria bacterium]|nr:LamB/YcsF family protein [Acidobacteriota bacterium]